VGRTFTKNATLVTIRFRFPEKDDMPYEIKRCRVKNMVSASTTIPGETIVEATAGVSIKDLPVHLGKIGYTLVDAFIRYHSSGTKMYYSANFVFGQVGERVQAIEGYDRKPEDVFHDFREICNSALWRTTIFRNPLFQDGKAIKGKCAIGFSFDERKPFLSRRGEKIVQKAEKKLQIVPSARTVKLV
jgi:hypothetical protein